jgi:hypothetical protein
LSFPVTGFRKEIEETHRHGLEWEAFWVEAKAKIPRLKAARDPPPSGTAA